MKNTLILTVLLISLLSNKIGYAQITTDSKREFFDFNQEWFFCIDSLKIGDEKQWFIQGIPVADKRKIYTPHTWNVEAGLEEFYGTGWYEKSFTAQEEWKGKIVRIKFGAIYRDADIYLNGELVKKHYGSGFTTFFVDISRYLSFSTSNLLVIKVNNEYTSNAIPFERSFDWPNDGGIHREVALVITDKNALDYVLATPTYEIINDKSKGRINIKAKFLSSSTISTKEIKVLVKISEENQTSKEILFEEQVLFKKKDEYYVANVDLEEINLWHFDHPNLYEIELGIVVGGKQTDDYSVTTGFKKFEVVGSKIFLNDEQVRLPGIEWMPGSNPDKGFAEDWEEINKMLSLIKEVNAVFVRFHWQQDERTIDWCNRNGILIQEEIPHWQKPNKMSEPIRASIKKNIDGMIIRDYNSPCIFSWGIGNELDGQSSEVYDFLTKSKAYIKTIDSLRLIGYASNTLHSNPGSDAGSICDFLPWNDYQGSWHSNHTDSIGMILDHIHKAHPEKPIFISEFGLCEPTFKGGDKRRIDDMKTHIDYYLDREYVAGAIYFSLNDYRTQMGEEGKGRYRQRVHGITNLIGEKKPSFEVLKEIWSPVEIEKIESTGDIIKVCIRCKNTLPKYILSEYYLLTEDAKGEQIELVKINNLQPGEVCELEVSECRSFKVLRPNGFECLSINL